MCFGVNSVMGRIFDIQLKNWYKEFMNTCKLCREYAIVFVYNDTAESDELHVTECVFPAELNMILTSFRQIALCVYSFNSERQFIDNIPKLKEKHKHILVYNMAQNIKGVGRRALIPLICRYSNLINIGSDEQSSFLSGNKKIMYDLLKHNHNIRFPKTHYINHNNIDKIINIIPDGTYILKPIDESASIGVKVIEINSLIRKTLNDELVQYNKSFSQFMLQEYIDGQEVEVPIINFGDNFYCPGAGEIVFDNKDNFLDYDTVGIDAYSFNIYSDVEDTLINTSAKVANILQFDAISRIDFRIKNGVPYIIDIGANPTISTHSTTNYLFTNVFGQTSSIYHILTMRALMNEGLFKPSFY